MPYNIKNLEKTIEKLKIAVIGDFCLDQLWHMDSEFDKKHDYNSDVSFALTNIEYSPGGAGNVANNFVKLGASVKCIGIVGDDGTGYQLIKCLKVIGADIENIIQTSKKETHTCIRSIRISENQESALNEIITQKFLDTDRETEIKIINAIGNIIDEVDAIVLVEQFDDDNKGVFTDNVKRAISSLAKLRRDKVFLVDSRKNIDKYENMYLKCNRSEFAGILIKDNIGEIEEMMEYNFKNSLALFITQGENGTIVIDDKRHMHNVPAVEVNQEINTCGAGDAATSGIVIGLCSGYDIKEAAMLGNVVASIAIKNLKSTGYATYEKLAEALEYNKLTV